MSVVTTGVNLVGDWVMNINEMHDVDICFTIFGIMLHSLHETIFHLEIESVVRHLRLLRLFHTGFRICSVAPTWPQSS